MTRDEALLQDLVPRSTERVGWAVVEDVLIRAFGHDAPMWRALETADPASMREDLTTAIARVAAELERLLHLH